MRFASSRLHRSRIARDVRAQTGTDLTPPGLLAGCDVGGEIAVAIKPPLRPVSFFLALPKRPCCNFIETYQVLLQRPKRNDVAPAAFESGCFGGDADLLSRL